MLSTSSGQELVSVFVPTTPNPTSGFYLLVEKKLVRELDMPVQQAFKLVITMGIAKEPELLTTTAKLQRKDLAQQDVIGCTADLPEIGPASDFRRVMAP